jgi:hypothetical protein
MELHERLDDSGQPVGPIHLEGPLHELLVEKASEMKALMSDGDIDDEYSRLPNMLRLMNETRALLNPMIENYVTIMRSFGHTWEEIGQVLGVSRQAAWEKYRHVDGTLPRPVVRLS